MNEEILLTGTENGESTTANEAVKSDAVATDSAVGSDSTKEATDSLSISNTYSEHSNHLVSNMEEMESTLISNLTDSCQLNQSNEFINQVEEMNDQQVDLGDLEKYKNCRGCACIESDNGCLVKSGQQATETRSDEIQQIHPVYSSQIHTIRNEMQFNNVSIEELVQLLEKFKGDVSRVVHDLIRK